MKLSDNFDVEEFVPKEVFSKFGSASMWFIDPRIPLVMEKIRAYFNKIITVNDWVRGGSQEQRGFRTNSKSLFSQHCSGRGVDFNVKGLTPQEVYPVLVSNYKVFGFSCVENIDATPTWNHIDLRWTLDDKLLIVKP